MATQYQLRRGTTAENLLFTGAQGEVTVDTDRHAMIVHDGVTAGGYPAATSPQVTNGTIYFNDNVAGGSAANAYILVAKSNTNTPTQYTDGLQLGFTTANPNTGPSSASFSGLGVKNMKYRGGDDPAPGDINGRVTVIFDLANDWFEIQRKATGPEPQIRSLTASVSSNTLIFSFPAQIVDFRSVTPSSGIPVSRKTSAAIGLVVPSGATLGTVSAVAAKLILLGIDTGTTIELAIANSASGFVFDESTLITTVSITAGATSASVIYSTTARANVAYRVLGFVNITEAAAGTWSTAPTITQGAGGNSLSSLITTSGFGFSQPPQNLTASRVLGTTYTNSTAKPILVIVNPSMVSAGATATATVAGVLVAQWFSDGSRNTPGTFMVPVGATYSAQVTAGTVNLNNWVEYR